MTDAGHKSMQQRAAKRSNSQQGVSNKSAKKRNSEMP
jgi:hypothetical protein